MVTGRTERAVAGLAVLLGLVCLPLLPAGVPVLVAALAAPLVPAARRRSRTGSAEGAAEDGPAQVGGVRTGRAA
jgi:hypothetical protein